MIRRGYNVAGTDGGDGDLGGGYIGPPINLPANPALPPAPSAAADTAQAVIAAVDNGASPKFATVLINNKQPGESGYTIPLGVGPFAVAGTSGYQYFYNNTSGVGGSICTVNRTTRQIISVNSGVSTTPPTPLYTALTNHKHSGSLNADGVTDPVPVNLSGETSGNLPYNQNSPGVQAIVNATGQILSTEFTSGTMNSDGSITNIDGDLSITTYSTSSGQVITVKGVIARGSTASGGGVFVGTDTNGYYTYFSSGGIGINKYVGGVLTNLGQILKTDDTGYHSYVICVRFAGGTNTIEGFFDSTYFGPYTDSTPPTLPNPAGMKVYTGGNSGKLQDFEVFLGGDPYNTLPNQIQQAVNIQGKLLASQFAGGTQNTDGSFSNVDSAGSATTFSTDAGQVVTAKAVISRGATTSQAGLFFGVPGTNGYFIYLSGSGIGINKYAASVLTNLGSAAVTGDTNYHSYVISVKFGAQNIIEGFYDSTYFGPFVDASPPAMSNPSGYVIYTGNNNGKLQDFEVYLGGDPYVSLPGAVTGTINSSGDLIGPVAMPALTYIAGGTWRGNYRLDLPSGGITNSLMPNASQSLVVNDWHTFDVDMAFTGGGTSGTNAGPMMVDSFLNGVLLDCIYNGTVIPYIKTGSTFTALASPVGISINDGKWHRITLKMAWNGTNVRFVPFVDGVKVGDYLIAPSAFPSSFLGVPAAGFYNDQAGTAYVRPLWNFSHNGEPPLMSSTALNQQASLLNVVGTPVFSYSGTTSSITITVPASTYTLTDKSTLSVGAYSNTWTGLTSGSTYHFDVYLDVPTKAFGVSYYITTPPTTAQIFADGYVDGRISIKDDYTQTASTGSGSGGGGTKGGGTSCPAVWQLVQTKEMGLIRADEVDLGMHFPLFGKWVEVLDAQKSPAPIWSYTLEKDGTFESFDVNDTHAALDINGKWLMVRDMKPGDQIKGVDGTYTVVDAVYLKDDYFIAFEVEGHEFTMGGALVHNFITL